MKNNTIGMFLALGAVCVCGNALDAQSNSTQLLATIPFAFQIAGQDFQAGRYVVRETGALGMPLVQSVATGNNIFVAGASRALPPAGYSKLVFHCYTGATCFLAEIRPATSTGSKIAMSKAEKAIANGERPREMAAISVGLHSAE